MKNMEKDIKQIQSSITMTVLLVSFSMLFATLFLGYFVFRVRSTVWPPMGMTDINLYYPTLSTLIILLSSGFYYLFEKNHKSKNLLMLSFLLGLGFCSTQIMVWRDLALQGITQSSGVFGSMLYGFTWIHIAHVFMGIVLLGWLNLSFFIFKKSPNKHLIRVKNIGLFWHFLGLVWLLMYLFLFVF